MNYKIARGLPAILGGFVLAGCNSRILDQDIQASSVALKLVCKLLHGYEVSQVNDP